MKAKIFAILTLILMAAAPGHAQDNQPMIGEPAPDFVLKDLSGNSVTLSQLRGNFVVIHFAASW